VTFTIASIALLVYGQTDCPRLGDPRGRSRSP
jgi:hypothetical protein